MRRLLRGGAAGEAQGASGRRIAGNIGLQMGGRVLGIVTSLVTLPLIARTLGADGFGVWAAALAYVTLFTAITEFGLTNAATMRMSADPEHEGEWLSALSSLRTLFSLVLSALCLAGLPFLVPDEGPLRTVALVLVISVLLTGAQSLMSVFQSRLRGEIPLALQVLQNLLWLATVVALAVAGAGPIGFAFGYVAMLATIAVLQVQAVRRLATVTWRGVRGRWRSLLQIAVPIGLANLFVTLYYKMGALMLIHLSDATETGVYGAAQRFLDPLVFLPASIMAAFLPVAAAHWETDRGRVRAIVQTCMEWMAVISFPAVATALVLSDQIVHLLFGDEYRRTAEVLPVLMVAFVAICYGNLAGYLAPVFGLQWRITLYAAAGAVVNVLLNLLLIPDHGALGAAWATVATEGVATALLLGTALVAVGLRPAIGRLGRIAVAAVAMGGVMLLAERLGLVPALLAGGVAYVVALWALRVAGPAELKALRRG